MLFLTPDEILSPAQIEPEGTDINEPQSHKKEARIKRASCGTRILLRSQDLVSGVGKFSDESEQR